MSFIRRCKYLPVAMAMVLHLACDPCIIAICCSAFVISHLLFVIYHSQPSVICHVLHPFCHTSFPFYHFTIYHSYQPPSMILHSPPSMVVIIIWTHLSSFLLFTIPYLTFTATIHLNLWSRHFLFAIWTLPSGLCHL